MIVGSHLLHAMQCFDDSLVWLQESEQSDYSGETGALLCTFMA